MFRRMLVAATAAAMASISIAAAPVQAAEEPTYCSAWVRSGAIEVKACVALTPGSISHQVRVRNLSSGTAWADASIRTYVNGVYVQPCGFSNFTVASGAVVTKSCTSARVNNYRYRTYAGARFGVNAYTWATSPTVTA